MNMENLKVYENFLNEAPEMPNLPQVRAEEPSTDVAVPADHTVATREQEAMRSRLEADVKRLYPNLSVRHTTDGQSGVAIDNVVIYATDHYEAFNAFLFGLVMAKMHGGENTDRMPAMRPRM
jgi:hypothetical protein